MPEMRKLYSIQHIQSAALFTRLSYNIEKSFDGTFTPELDAEHGAYVTGAIFSAVSFLEATINELFADIADKHEKGIDSDVNKLEPKAISMMANLWKIGIPRSARYSTLEKYQIALILTEKTIFVKGENPYQDVSHLVKLRNALIHYEPEWIPLLNEGELHKYESTLKGKFKENPITGPGNPFFPYKCLGHGCAEWGVISSINFVEEFFSRLGLTPRFNHMRDNMKTK